jgi:uncharacterized membrane protein
MVKIMKINWKSKLTSRKFWLAVTGFVTPLLATFGVSGNAGAQVAAIIMAGATLIAYIIGEGLVDASAASGGNTSAAASGIE